ncbi:hypothetical protein COT97_04700 [Candidatus Falkowbacteria bacterium CG10_big_fil_rev_8_21_14_0_10_39_11]|uniref:Uncharacterized protein n=1 Tax=Candidatus Falkowbacteria bacterium CG10_big_fil_rev_8_21_14_0_10_39_11 TaxID=1974565 RepID=A0A2H0V403_9BACT|nr:MAG: hypothetical protein COT97_04700 [Candidatus Falkowbacteria bacterium CG10_big_fil_rev_8_21_14_0_10_39_11]
MTYGAELMTIESRPLTIIDQPPTISILVKFREIFRAEWCIQRKVFYFEYKWKRTRLWQIIDQKGTKKLITAYIGEPNIDVLRILIASANTYFLLTGVRWELYDSSKLDHLIEMGRFDLTDFMPSGGVIELESLIKKYDIAVRTEPEAWDFDALYLTHLCPFCAKPYQTDILFFNPTFISCEHCGYNFSQQTKPEFQKRKSRNILEIIKKLLSLLSQDKNDCLPISNNQNPIILYFMNGMATAVISWLTLHIFCGDPIIYSISSYDFSLEEVVSCLQQSVFHQFHSKTFRQFFIDFYLGYCQYHINKIENDDFDLPTTSKQTRDEYKAWVLKNWHETKDDFMAEVETLADLESWLLMRKQEYINLDSKERNEKVTRIRKAVSGFTFYIESMVDFLHDRMTHKLTEEDYEPSPS